MPNSQASKTDKSGTSPPSMMDRRALVELHAPYVRSIVGKIKKSVPHEISFEELYDYGIIGLLEAADRFDASLGVAFTTYAYYRIRGAIYDGLRRMGWVSRSAYAKARFEARANAYLEEAATHPNEEADPKAGPQGPSSAPPEAQDGRHPLEAAVQDLATVVHSLAAVYITSLDAATEAKLIDDSQLGPEEKVGLEELRALVRNTIRRLSPEERQLLELYYYKDKSMQQVGDQLGLSKSWTSRLHARVIDKLHRMLEES